MKVSAIISAYYCERFLQERIENLHNQTTRPQIVVVAQRGSAEADIAEKHLYRHLWGDMLIETEDVPTIYKAWNLGIKAAHGQYVTNANADDRLAKWGIEHLSSILDRMPEIAVAYADVDIVNNLIGGFDHAWRIGYFRWAEGGFEELQKHCFLGPMPMWRRSLHEKHGWFDEEMKSAGDYEFWLRISKAGERFHHIREPLGIYLRRDDQSEARYNADGTAAKEIEIAKERYK